MITLLRAGGAGFEPAASPPSGARSVPAELPARGGPAAGVIACDRRLTDGGRRRGLSFSPGKKLKEIIQPNHLFPATLGGGALAGWPVGQKAGVGRVRMLQSPPLYGGLPLRHRPPYCGLKPNLKPEICSRQGNRTLATHQHENGIEPLPIHQYAASVILCLIADGRHLRHHPSAFFVVVYYALIPALGRALSTSRCPCLHVSGISTMSMC